MKKPKIGLVLEGGGAKGAFSFGVLCALKDAKISFDAVSGSSVGALNAILWSTDSVQEGKTLWEELSFGKIFSRNHAGPVGRLIAVYILLKQLIGSVFGAPVHNARQVRRAAGVILSLPYGIGIAVQIAGSATDNRVAFTALGVFLGSALTWVGGLTLADDQADKSVGSRSALYLLTLEWICLPTFIGWFAGGLAGLLVVSCGLLVLAKLDRIARNSVHNSEPLRKTLGALVSKPFVSKTFVTTAVARNVWNPDREDIIHRTLAGASIPVRQHYEEYVPLYHCLNDVEPEKRADFAIASAALPLGIVDGVYLEREIHVDGGVADNCPTFPVLSICDVVVVIHLSTKREHFDCGPWPDNEVGTVGLRSAAAYLRERVETILFELYWECINRILHVSEYCQHHGHPPPDTEPISTDEVVLRSAPPNPFPAILPCFPHTSLGGLLCGTLNFGSERAKKLMRQGEIRGTMLAGEIRSEIARCRQWRS